MVKRQNSSGKGASVDATASKSANPALDLIHKFAAFDHANALRREVVSSPAGDASAGAPRSLAAKITKQIRDDVVTCRLLPGEKVHIGKLRDRFDVSLSAVREGLSRLVAEGLIVAEDQRGFRVAPVSVADLIDLWNVRSYVETLALSESIKHGDTDWEAGCLAAYHKLSKCQPFENEVDAILTHDWRSHHEIFHRSLVSGCASPWTLMVRDLLCEQAERYRNLAALHMQRSPSGRADEHKDILDAVLARDVDKAVRIYSLHLQNTQQALIDFYTSKNRLAIPEPA